jgi:hypothetical protein
MTGEFAVPSPAQLAQLAAETHQDAIGGEDEKVQVIAALPHAGSDVCSWCGKHGTVVKKLLTGPGVQICNECVALCYMILRDELPDFG